MIWEICASASYSEQYTYQSFRYNADKKSCCKMTAIYKIWHSERKVLFHILYNSCILQQLLFPFIQSVTLKLQRLLLYKDFPFHEICLRPLLLQSQDLPEFSRIPEPKIPLQLRQHGFPRKCAFLSHSPDT